MARLQKLLSAVLDVPVAAPIGPYLIGPEVHRRMPGANPQLPEQIFVGGGASGAGGEVHLSVYISPEILRQLAADDPFGRLWGGNLDAFWVALEGVSHFVMTTWRATWAQPVSALELEIQAEVDKFVATLVLAARPPSGACVHGACLWRRLFVDCAWHPHLSPREALRYRAASAVAAAFCREVLADLPRGRADRRCLLRAARRWFRWPLARKLALGRVA